MRKPALRGQTSDVSNIRKTKKCCNYPKNCFTMANIRYAKHPKNQNVLQTSEKQLFQGKHPISQTSKKPKSAANMRKPALSGQISDISNIQKPKSAANIRKAAFPGQTSDMSNIQKNKKYCKHPKSSFSRANVRCVKHPKNQKVLQTCENQFYQGKHPICQTSEKPKSAAIIRKLALPWQTSDMPNIRKTKKCCKHPKSSFSRANIRYVKHPKNQKVQQICENELYQGKHPIFQTSEKPKSAAIIRKPALPWQSPDMPNIRKTKKCCKHPKSSFSRANIRYVKHPKSQKSCKHAKTSFTRANIRYVKYSKTKKCCKHPKSSFSSANIRYVKHPKKNKSAANIRKAAFPGQTSDVSNIRKTKKKKLQTCENELYQGKHPICQTSKNQKVLQTSERQLFQGNYPKCQTSEKPKSAAYMRKPNLSGQTSDMSNIRKTKKCCKHPKTSFTRANIRYVKHPKNQKVLQTCENQLYQGKHPICQTSEKPKSAANKRKPA